MKTMKSPLLFPLVAILASTAYAEDITPENLPTNTTYEYEFSNATSPYFSQATWGVVGRADWVDVNGVTHKSWGAVTVNYLPPQWAAVSFKNNVIIDGQFDISCILNPGGANKDITVEMFDPNTGEYSNQCLNIDTKKTTDSNKVISMRNYKNDGTMTFLNGVVNAADTSKTEAAAGTHIIDLFSNSQIEGVDYKKTLNFGSLFTFNTTQNVSIQGHAPKGVLHSTFNLEGAINAKQGETYRDVLMSNVEANIKTASTIVAKSLVAQNNAKINIESGANLSIANEIRAENTSFINIADGLYLGNLSTKTNGSGTINIGTIGSLNMTYGGTISASNTSTINIYGKYQTVRPLETSPYSDNVNLTDSAVLHMHANSTLDVISSYNGVSNHHRDVNLQNNSKLIIDEGAKLITNRWVRMGGTSTLVLNGSNSLLTSLTATSSKDSIIWLWSGSQRIEFNADYAIKGFCFAPRLNSTSTSTTELTIALGANCNYLDLSTFTTTTDGFSGFLDNGASLIIEGFDNYKIHIDSLRVGFIDEKTGQYSEDRLTNITAEGWEDFYLEADEINGGYWLNAIQVPEPATLASIIGVLALIGVIYSRRNLK